MRSHVQRANATRWNLRIRHLMAWQFFGVLGLAGFGWLLIPSFRLVSFSLGGLLVVLSAWLMAGALSKDGVDMKGVYRSAVLRYLFFLAALLAAALLGMDLLAVVAGMAAAYVLGFICSAWLVRSIDVKDC
ncbi:MAG: hypothetical protein R8K49_05955 [Mariprofundaceae bacterium]